MENVFCVNDVAVRFDVNPETVRRWIKDGKLSAWMSSKKEGYEILETELNEFIISHPKYAQNDWKGIVRDWKKEWPSFSTRLANALCRNDIKTWDELYEKTNDLSILSARCIGWGSFLEIVSALIDKGYDTSALEDHIKEKEMKDKQTEHVKYYARDDKEKELDNQIRDVAKATNDAYMMAMYIQGQEILNHLRRIEERVVGYPTSVGYRGWVERDKCYRLFATEADYREYIGGSEEENELDAMRVNDIEQPSILLDFDCHGATDLLDFKYHDTTDA